MKDGFSLVRFEVEANLKLGQSLSIYGDDPHLGSFNRQDIKEMYTDPTSFPIWHLSVLLPKDSRIKYKYVITEMNKFAVAESCDTRIVFTGSGVKVKDKYDVKQASKEEEVTMPLSPQGSLSSSVGAASTEEKVSGPVQAKRLVLIAFNLPVKLKYLGENEQEELWECTWDTDNVAAKTEDSVADEIEVVWVGAITPAIVHGIEYDFQPSAKRMESLKSACGKLNCIPIFLDQRVYSGHYVQFCKTRLWDIFHNVLRPSANASDNSYEEYVKGNMIFAREGAKYVKSSSDIVWVHDYHLMLVPKMLREQSKHMGPIIVFLHLPFPTSEIFRTLSQRHEILEGMLSASTIGFHTFNHGRHFLTSCKRFLGADSRSGQGGILAVDYRDRKVLITISHVGVDPRRLQAMCENPATIEMSKQLSVYSFPGALHHQARKTVTFGSLDYLQRLKGVPLRLLAFERLLATSTRWHNGGARFVLWTITNNARAHDSKRSKLEVKMLVNRINDANGPVVELREFDSMNPPTLQQRVALWLATDVFVSTAVSEGLNLMPLEYLFVRGDKAPGALIVSEFSSCAAILNGALRVNCYNIAEIAKAMDETARMPLEERRARRSRDVDYITSPTSKWTRYIINEVMTVMNDESFKTIEQGGGLLNLPRFIQKNQLLKSNYLKSYITAERRVIFLDFGGTLVEREQENLVLKRDFLGVRGRGLSQSTKKVLVDLCSDPKNVVFIVSGETRTVLTRVFYDLLGNTKVRLGIVAHSGLCIRMPSNSMDGGGEIKLQKAVSEFSVSGNETVGENDMSPMPPKAIKLFRGDSVFIPGIQREHSAAEVMMKENSTGISLLAEKALLEEPQGRSEVYDLDMEHKLVLAAASLNDWKMVIPGVMDVWQSWMRLANVVAILNKYTWTTNGAVFRNTPITTTFDYTRSDPEWGFSQASFLVKELETALAAKNLPVDVKHTKSTVQLLPRGVDKGAAVARVLKSLSEICPTWKDAKPDYILCIGDDFSDELMFTSIHNYCSQHEDSEFKDRLFTSTVGSKNTYAQYYCRDVEAVHSVLNNLVTVTKSDIEKV